MPVLRSSRRSKAIAAISHNSASGCEIKRSVCIHCRRASRLTKETIHSGMTLVRVRYGLPYCELPDVVSSDLSRFLLFLLQQGKARDPCFFPRRQLPPDDSGLCNLQRLCRRSRWGLAHSLSSIKRNLPAGCSLHTPSARSSWEKNAFSSPPPSSEEYLSFVRKEATLIFTNGWDRNYDSFVWNHLPNSSARACGGRADQLWAGHRGDFINACLKESEVTRFEARYKEVASAGKSRPLLIFDQGVDLLAPLHKMMFSFLRGHKWLLCGPPTDERMTSVCVNDYQTSVDLVAATDNLSHDVAKAILDVAFFPSVKLPRSIRSLAYASLSPSVSTDGGIKNVSHGQMMGAYLSFPLLCLQSYIAARWASRRCPETRILVNGDDCVISADQAIEVEDYPSGYVLNDLKTIRAKNVVEVNSTCFLREGGGKWREVRHLRRGGAPSDFAGVMHMASAVRGSAAWTDSFVRARIGRSWGFLPCQLGLNRRSYSAWERARSLGQTRLPTALPSLPQVNSDQLIPLGRRGTPIEAEATRSLLWRIGREGGKRDVFNPSRGLVRRSYRYYHGGSWRDNAGLSFVGQIRGDKISPPMKNDFGSLIPRDFVTEEENEGLRLLDLWRSAFDSLAAER